VNEQLLRESKLVRGHFVGIKILGDGELKHELKVEADKISATAREKIEKAGGTITLREKGAAVAAGSSKEERSGARAPKAIVKKKSKALAKGKKKASRDS